MGGWRKCQLRRQPYERCSVADREAGGRGAATGNIAVVVVEVHAAEAWQFPKSAPITVPSPKAWPTTGQEGAHVVVVEVQIGSILTESRRLKAWTKQQAP